MDKQRPVTRLTSELFNKPHLISQTAFTAIAAYLDVRNTGKLDVVKLGEEEGFEEADVAANTVGDIGIINIHGSLTNKPVVTMCGVVGASYASIKGQMSALIEAGCKTVVLDIDSGGGEAFNCFQTADAIRKMADDNGVYLISYVQSMAASAAYALAVCADEVVCHPQGQVGSVGVLVALMNNTKALEKEGYQRTFVTAGANKIPFDADGGFRDEFLAEIQANVDDLYGQFCEHVSHYTGLSVADVKATEASVFSGNKALGMGMINTVMTNEEFADYLTKREYK
jgi:ClpP class serine protease